MEETMKIKTITVGVRELRKTEPYENKTFHLELTAEVDEGDDPRSVQKNLEDQIAASCAQFFEEDPEGLKRKVRAYQERFGVLR